MRPINLQFFLMFGSLAAVQPYLPLLLKERGMGEEQIGYALGMSGWAIMLSPALVTLFADTKIQPRRMVALLAIISALALVALISANTFWLLTCFYLLYALVIASMVPLQDGIAFGIQKMNLEQGKPEIHYNKVRVWGTYGYMIMLVLLFFPLKWADSVELSIYFGIGCFILLIANSFVLPNRGKRETAKRVQGLPTSDAVKALFQGNTVYFSVGMFLLLACSAAYHTMYPVFLSDTLGLANHWVGIVIMSGTILEIYFIHSLSNWEKRWGLRVVMLTGIVLTLVRFGLMFTFPNLIVAIGTQIFHGPMICAMMVIPPSFLNSLANESNRNSMQGVFTMLIMGTSRFVGTAMSGHAAAIDQRMVYLLCGALTAGSLAFMWFGFRPKHEKG